METAAAVGFKESATIAELKGATASVIAAAGVAVTAAPTTAGLERWQQ